MSDDGDKGNRDSKGRFGSGNRASPGRPKNPECLTAVLRRMADELPRGATKTRAQLLGERIWDDILADEADPTMRRWIYDRLDGTPRQTIDTGSSGPLTVVVTHSTEGL